MGVLKKLNKYFLSVGSGLAGCMFLSGCHTDFTPDIDARPVLCLNSLITAGEPISVHVTRSWVYTDVSGERNHEVNDAVVTLFANGVEVGVDYLPREGDVIRIQAFSPAYGEAEASVKVPVAPLLKDVESFPLLKEGRVQDYESTFRTTIDFDLGIHVTLVDSPEAVNYYHYGLENYAEYEGGKESDPHEEDSGTVEEESSFIIRNGILKYEAEPIFGEHISEFDAMMGGDAYGFTFFTDRQFSGSSYRLNLQYLDIQAVITCTPDNIEEVCEAGFVICLSSVSESYYNWFNYCWQVYSGGIGDLSSAGLTEPMKGYSNVSTGAGVVAARSMTEVRIPLDDFFIPLVKRALEKLRPLPQSLPIPVMNMQ